MTAVSPEPRSTGKAMLRRLWASGKLALTAIAIVLALAFGIPWLIGLVWR